MSNQEIEKLADEAGQAGDDAQVKLCEAALNGDKAARAECERVLTEARANRVRIFRGDSTSQLQHDGRKADPELWYYEPRDYEGDVLWSKGYGSRAEAYHAAGLSQT